MNDMKLGEIELRFAKIVWAKAPLGSGELVKLAAEAFSWKKSTTYTVLKKLCEKGLFENRNGIVSVRISEEEYLAIRSEKTVEEEYTGSLPSFIAAFTSRKALTRKEVDEIMKIIENNTKEG